MSKSANAIRKGKRGEREFCHALHDLGYAARRSEQHNGSVPDGAPDVYTDLDEEVYLEVKRRDSNLWRKEVRDWLRKTREEAPSGKDPVMAWKPNYCPVWLCFLPLEANTEHDFKVLYGTEALVDYYDPERQYASLLPRSQEDRHDVIHTSWL